MVWAQGHRRQARRNRKNTINRSSVVTLAAGSSHNCALRNDGAVLCWGGDLCGRVGEASAATRYLTTPQIVNGIGIGSAIGISTGASGQQSCALLANVSAKCWGYGTGGQLGDGSKTDRRTPTAVVGLSSGVMDVAAGFSHSCATRVDGGMKCWGSRQGAIGDGVKWTSSADYVQPIPSSVVGFSGPVVSLGTSWDYTCAVVVSGAVECWGAHPTGALPNAQQACATAHIGLIADQRLLMAEYRHAARDYYFITSRDQEQLLLKAIAPDFQCTGGSFVVNPTGFQADGKSITRLYFDAVAKSGSRGSHFYTLVNSERATFNGLNPSNATAPRLPYNEGVDSFAFAPAVEGVGGSCASGHTAVYRAFRGNA